MSEGLLGGDGGEAFGDGVDRGIGVDVGIEFLGKSGSGEVFFDIFEGFSADVDLFVAILDVIIQYPFKNSPNF